MKCWYCCELGHRIHERRVQNVRKALKRFEFVVSFLLAFSMVDNTRHAFNLFITIAHGDRNIVLLFSGERGENEKPARLLAKFQALDAVEGEKKY